jgi:hypothetical protein
LHNRRFSAAGQYTLNDLELAIENKSGLEYSWNPLPGSDLFLLGMRDSNQNTRSYPLKPDFSLVRAAFLPTERPTESAARLRSM